VRGCEENRELAVPLVHGACYKVRPPGLDGTREISLRDLVKFALADFVFSFPFAAGLNSALQDIVRAALAEPEGSLALAP
jgi:hypothetical protein